MTTSAAIGYARISKDDTLEGRGTGRQEADIRSYAQRKRWRLTEVLVDNDVSASRYSTKARTNYSRLVETIEVGAVDRVIVYDLDRLLRQPRELEDLIDLCERRNGSFELHNVNGELDLTTSDGRFVARMLVAKAAKESDDLSRRLKRAFDQKASEGRPHGARAFGYQADGITIDNSEARLLKAAARDVLKGESLNAIARRWNAAGVFTPQRRKMWSGTIVKAVLTNPRQAGLRVHRGDVVGNGVWSAIIDRATHERLVALLTDPHRRRTTPPRRQPFTSLIRSAETGLPLDRDTIRGRPTYRGHNRPGRMAGNLSIAALPLERLIEEALFSVVDGEGRAPHIGGVGNDDADTSLRELAEAEARLTELAEMLGAGDLDRAGYLTARKRAQADRDDAQKRLVSSGRARTSVEFGPVRPLRTAWPKLSDDRKRTIISEFIDRVLIAPAKQKGGPGIEVDRVDIVWRH